MEPLGNSLARIRRRLKTATTDLVAEPEPEPICKLCNDFGYVRRDVPLDHPDFGRAIPCKCRGDEMRERLRRRSQIGHLIDRNFDTFSLDRPHFSGVDLGNAVDFLRDWADNPTCSLVLCGPPGCGKTHLAAAIANKQLDLGNEVFFAVVPDLLDHLRATFAPGSDISYDELFETVKTTPLLILDDLGTQSGTPWAREKLFQILNYRYTAQLPTVITSNEPLAHLDERLRARFEDTTAYLCIHVAKAEHQLIDSLADVWPEGLKNCRFETFDDRGNRSLQEAKQLAWAFAEDPDGWLVLEGMVGCGKTHLAAAIKNARDDNHAQTLFKTAPDLLDYLRATYAPDSNITYDKGFDAIRNASVLILDDYGAHSSTQWAEEKLFQLLNHRFNARLATVITTNQPLERLPTKGAPTQELRIRSRMLQLARVCHIDAPPFKRAPATRARTAR